MVTLRRNVVVCWVCVLGDETVRPLEQPPAIEPLGEYLHASVPMGGHLHTKLVVTHPKEKLVYDHLLLGVVVHEQPC